MMALEIIFRARELYKIWAYRVDAQLPWERLGNKQQEAWIEIVKEESEPLIEKLEIALSRDEDEENVLFTCKVCGEINNQMA